MGKWVLSEREPVDSGGLDVSMIPVTRAVQTEKIWRKASGSLIMTLPVLDLSTTACLATGW